MKRRNQIALCILLVAAAGTAEAQSVNMNKKECLSADWRALGVADGQAGLADKALEIRTKGCAKHKVTLDAAAYAEGRTQGLTVFCTPVVALDAGAAGKGDPAVCGPDAAAVQEAYKAGRDYYKAKNTYESRQSSYNGQVTYINIIRGEIRRFQSDYNSSKEPALRDKRMSQILDRQGDLSRAEGNLPFLQSQVLDAELELRSAQQVFSTVKADLKAKSLQATMQAQAPASADASAAPAAGTQAPAAPKAGAGPDAQH
jgi:hypothetical protein